MLALQWAKYDPENAEFESHETLKKLQVILETMEEEGFHEDCAFCKEDTRFTNTRETLSLKLGTEGNMDDPIPHQCDVKKEFYCLYCNIMCGTESELRNHCNSENHQLTIMSDEGSDWKYRPPPRGISGEQYTLCQMYYAHGKCKLGQQCCEAHGDEELLEWKERFAYRQMKLQHAKECHLHGNHYTEQLLEKWTQSTNPDLIMKENLNAVDVSVSPGLNITVSDKNNEKHWTFTVKAKIPLRHAALLFNAHRTHFYISTLSVVSDDKSEQTPCNIDPECQEWTNPYFTDMPNSCEFHYSFQVVFTTSIFGTFRQAIVFDFGTEPVLVKRFSVDVVPISDFEKLQKAKESVVSFIERWDHTNAIIIPFENCPYSLNDKEENLLATYPVPKPSTFEMTQSAMELSLNKDNYFTRLHELLYIEEMAQYELLSRYNIRVRLRMTSCYLLTPNAATTAKYAQNGELYACVKINSVLSEDSACGRLVLTSSNLAYLAPVHSSKQEGKKKVYEAIIEDKGKVSIYLRLSKRCVEDLRLKPNQEVLFEVQFQLNRLSFCEMHSAVDKLFPITVAFPDVCVLSPIPWNPKKQWNAKLDPRLNPKQKEAIVAITTPMDVRLPPILIIGPFGTGKTFTMAQAVKMILADPNTRVLLCTHSNSAADIYIREYFHPYVNEGYPEAKPLRIYYRHRWVSTVHPVVLQYCLIAREGEGRSFNLPTIMDIKKHRIVVTTLSTSVCLSQLGLEKGFFTHILIDEAAQAMECEAIMPLALATETTRIVLAGDHMQLSPEVYSRFAQEQNLHMSLLERLHDFYPQTFPCKIMLCENYRSHEAIIQYTSELFYDNRLLASGKQPRHEAYYPLTFFTARGEDVQDQNSTAFHNYAEVYEIVERVSELQKSWPESWGELDENSIGIVTPYYDQVIRIRAELRKKRKRDVSVERVLNVQGKQFRVIFLSTVRTHHTCSRLTQGNKDDGDLEHGFLSNAKLLNTAITRAQSLVAVVGDPVSLCSVGKCRKLWEKFIQICHKEKSLFGITWNSIQTYLDGMELKKNYVLNPLAPEFIPGRRYHNTSCLPGLGNFWYHPNTLPVVLYSIPGPPVQPSQCMWSPGGPVPYNIPPLQSYSVGMTYMRPVLFPPPPVQNFSQPFVVSSRPPGMLPRSGPRKLAPVRGVLPSQPSTTNIERNQMVSPAVARTFQNRDISHLQEQSKFKNLERKFPGESTPNDDSSLINVERKDDCQVHQSGHLESNLSNSEDLSKFTLGTNTRTHQWTKYRNDDDYLTRILHDSCNINSSNSSERHPISASKNEHVAVNSVSPCLSRNIWSFSAPNAPSESEKMNSGTICSEANSVLKQSVETYHPPVSLHNITSGEYNSNSSMQSGSNEISDLTCPTVNPLLLQQHDALIEALERGYSTATENYKVNSAGRHEVPSMCQIPINQLYSSLKEKLLLLEKILPPGTDVKAFMNSIQQQRGFYFYLLASEGTIVAKRFVGLISNIRKDQECIHQLQTDNFTNIMFSEKQQAQVPPLQQHMGVPNVLQSSDSFFNKSEFLEAHKQSNVANNLQGIVSSNISDTPIQNNPFPFPHSNIVDRMESRLLTPSLNINLPHGDLLNMNQRMFKSGNNSTFQPHLPTNSICVGLQDRQIPNVKSDLFPSSNITSEVNCNKSYDNCSSVVESQKRYISSVPPHAFQSLSKDHRHIHQPLSFESLAGTHHNSHPNIARNFSSCTNSENSSLPSLFSSSLQSSDDFRQNCLQRAPYNTPQLRTVNGPPSFFTDSHDLLQSHVMSNGVPAPSRSASNLVSSRNLSNAALSSVQHLTADCSSHNEPSLSHLSQKPTTDMTYAQILLSRQT